MDAARLGGGAEPALRGHLTYALCGFANFSSIGIQIGGIGGLAPSAGPTWRRLGFRAMLGGTLACFMTACVAGICCRFFTSEEDHGPITRPRGRTGPFTRRDDH